MSGKVCLLKNTVPSSSKLFTNLSQTQRAVTSLPQNRNQGTAAFSTVTFHVEPAYFLSRAEMPLKTHGGGANGPKPEQPTARHRLQLRNPQSHTPSWMTSSPLTALTAAQIPAGLVSRTAVHWFTVGRFFGRATARSIIIF